MDKIDKVESLFTRVLKHPLSWLSIVVPLVIVALFILYGDSLASSALASFISVAAAITIYFFALRVAMWLKFLSQNEYVNSVKGDPRALSILIASIVIGVSIVIHGAF